MFKNLYLIHRSGKILFSKNIAGDKLDQSFVVVFASSVSNFCKTLVKEEVRDISTLHGRIFLKSIGQFTLLVHCDLSVGRGIVQTMKELSNMLELLFGPSENWDSESKVFDVTGCHDLLTMYFVQTNIDPFVVTKGINQVH